MIFHQWTMKVMYLVKKVTIGKALKKIEAEWIKNNFKITKNKIQEIIRLYSN